MSQIGLSNEITTENQSLRFPHRLLFLSSVIFIVVCFPIAVLFWSLISNVERGYYNVDQVILSSDLKDNQPVDIKDVFKPSDTIICTVTTTGDDGGIIGMRWFFEDKMIYETTHKAQNNMVYSAIRSNSSTVLEEGKYHVDIFVINEILQTVNFEIKIYHPSVNPPISIPTGHSSIELPWFPEVPFVFDELWKIGDNEWKVNEVKVLLRDATQEYFVAVVIDTNMKDVASLSESEAKKITRPIALYALENGYVEKAKSFAIDGKYYDLDQYIYVILMNPVSHQVYRVEFTLDELKSDVQAY